MINEPVMRLMTRTSKHFATLKSCSFDGTYINQTIKFLFISQTCALYKPTTKYSLLKVFFFNQKLSYSLTTIARKNDFLIQILCAIVKLREHFPLFLFCFFVCTFHLLNCFSFSRVSLAERKLQTNWKQASHLKVPVPRQLAVICACQCKGKNKTTGETK